MSKDSTISRHDEKALIDYTVQLRDQYKELGAIISQVEDDPSMTVDAITQQMKQIKTTEGILGPLREAYQQTHQDTSGPLKEVTDETIEVVKDLMPKLAALEKASVDSLRRLFPKIQGSVRAVQMRNAYKGNSLA